jgi:hypothetical protein
MSPELASDEWKWVSVVEEEPRGNGRLGFKPRNPPGPLFDFVGHIDEAKFMIYVIAGVTRAYCTTTLPYGAGAVVS